MPRNQEEPGTTDAPRQQRSDDTPGVPGAAGTEKSPASVGKPPIAPGQLPGEVDSGLATPHERDQSVGTPDATPRPVMEQARRDLESGQVDTDMRTTPGLDADRRDEAVRGGGR